MKIRNKGLLKLNIDRLLSCDPAARDQSLRDQATYRLSAVLRASPDAPAACPRLSISSLVSRDVDGGDHCAQFTPSMALGVDGINLMVDEARACVIKENPS